MFDTPETTEEVIIKEKINKNFFYIGAGIVILIVMILSWFTVQNSNTEEEVIETEVPEQIVLEDKNVYEGNTINGKVISVDVDNKQFVISSYREHESLSEDLTEKEDIIIKISENTVLKKSVFIKNKLGRREHSGDISINVSDFQINDEVSVLHQGEVKDGLLENVEFIFIITPVPESSEDISSSSSQVASDSYQLYDTSSSDIDYNSFNIVKGRIVSIADDLSSITYYMHPLVDNSLKTSTALLEEYTPVFTVSENLFLSSKEDKERSSRENITTGSDVYIILDKNTDISQDKIAVKQVLIVK